MNLKDKWLLVQHELLRRGRSLPKFGPDGDPGEETVDALIEEFNLAPERMRSSPIVKGTGRNIRRIFIHCSATPAGKDFDAATIRGWHRAKGWSDIGYHFVIRIDGTIERGRPEHLTGAHAQGFNTGSIAMVYVGGLDAQGRAADTRTDKQKAAMEALTRALTQAYPGSDVLGHRDISPDRDGDGVIEPHEWLKQCPCFDVRSWWATVK